MEVSRGWVDRFRDGRACWRWRRSSLRVRGSEFVRAAGAVGLTRWTAVPAYRLRATTTQAIPPIDRFGMLPMVTITGDNRVVVAGRRSRSSRVRCSRTSRLGRSATVASRRSWNAGGRSGCSSGSGDFVPPDVMPGASLGRIEIVVDGVAPRPDRATRHGSSSVSRRRATRRPARPRRSARSGRRSRDLTWLGGDLGRRRRHTSPTRTLIARSAWSRSTIRPSGPRWRSGRSSNRSRRSASRSDPRRRRGAGRSATRTPRPSGRASRRRTS